MPRKLKSYYQNVRGLRSKIKCGLKNEITLANFDLVGLTETWLNSDFSSNEIFDDSYNVFRSDRSVEKYNLLRNDVAHRDATNDIRGGGCLIALKNDISAIRLTEWENEILFDNVWIRINTSGNSKIFINNIYIPPWASFDHVKAYYEQIFEIVNTREPYSRFILMGDFNLANIDWCDNGNHCIPSRYEGRFAIEFINIIQTTNLTQKNGIKNKFGRTLDLIISNIPISVNRGQPMVNEDDHHPALKFDFDSSDIKFLKSKKSAKFNFFKADYDGINNELRSIDWYQLLNSNDVNVAVDIFYNKIYEIIRKHTPICTPKSDKYPKWFSKKLIDLIADKNYYRRKMKTSNGEHFAFLFREKRREEKREKRRCLKAYITSIEPMITANPKSFFAYTKSQKQSNKLPSAISYKGKVAQDMKQAVNLFAEYFSSVYENHTNQFNLNITNETQDFSVSMETIAKVISDVNIFKTNSPDGIPGIFFKHTSDLIKIPLHILFNMSIRSMTYPDKWKISFVSPIFKSGDNTNVENYRPISILSAISKFFDKIIYLHIREKTAHLLTEYQHGFCMGKSTLTNLLEFTDYITQNIMNGGQIDTVLMDLSKAFDKICHSILLYKLSQLQINPRTINLIKSYLQNRTQIVCVYGEKSNPIKPKSSVPQGSILSPLLFALFINDLPQLIKSNILLYADDLKIFSKITTVDDAITLQNDVKTIVNWCHDNKLQINVSKCNVISFTRRREITFQYFNYNINGNALNRVQLIKDLGVTFDSKLTFENHIKIITNRAYKMLGFIFRSLNHFKQSNTYKILYFTYVRSILEYCTPVWSPHYDVHINTIEKVQRRFTRILFRRFKYPEEKHFYMRNVRLELLSLEERRTITHELTLYKVYSNRVVTALNNQIRPSIRSRITRQNNLFYLPHVTTNVEYFSPMLRMQRQHDNIFKLNSLNEESFNAFKRYTLHEIKKRSIMFDYRFNEPNQNINN